MMSTSEGGGGSWKSGHSKGGWVNFILHINQFQMWTTKEGKDKGGGGPKIRKFCGCH